MWISRQKKGKDRMDERDNVGERWRGVRGKRRGRDGESGGGEKERWVVRTTRMWRVFAGNLPSRKKSLSDYILPYLPKKTYFLISSFQMTSKSDLSFFMKSSLQFSNYKPYCSSVPTPILSLSHSLSFSSLSLLLSLSPIFSVFPPPSLYPWAISSTI